MRAFCFSCSTLRDSSAFLRCSKTFWRWISSSSVIPSFAAAAAILDCCFPAGAAFLPPAPGFAAPGLVCAPTVRRFLVSTTTCLERPWLKVCFTVPDPDPRETVSGLRPPVVPLSFVSLMRTLVFNLSFEAKSSPLL